MLTTRAALTLAGGTRVRDVDLTRRDRGGAAPTDAGTPGPLPSSWASRRPTCAW